MSDDTEREHAATAKRRQQFAERGEVAQSRDLLGAAVLLGGVVALYRMGTAMARALVQAMDVLMRDLQHPLDSALFKQFGAVFVHLVMPFACATAATAVAVGVLQHRGVPPWRMPGFNLGKVNPLAKGLQIFGPKKMALSVLTNLVKTAALGVVFYGTLAGPLMRFVMQMPSSLHQGLSAVGKIADTVVRRGVLVFVVFGVLDYGLNWWRLEKRMRMSTQDLRDENKDSSGDPSVRGRRRRLAKELLRQRSMKEVPKADVVIVNPTHYAVAVLYKDGNMVAPQVVAKGVDAMAEQIRAIARRHQVPVVSQPPLARLLYAQVKVGHAIPAETYQAVAVVLAHVYRLKRRAS